MVVISTVVQERIPVGWKELVSLLPKRYFIVRLCLVWWKTNDYSVITYQAVMFISNI